VVDGLFKFAKFSEDTTGMIKIAEEIQPDGPKMNLGEVQMR
jgi:hypothetical protein